MLLGRVITILARGRMGGRDDSVAEEGEIGADNVEHVEMARV
jgi:hypothetical protein